MIVSAHRGVSLTDVAAPAFERLAQLAWRYGTSKTRVARAIVEGIQERDAEKLVAACCAKPQQPRGRRHKVLYAEAVDQPRPAAARRQDDICREIHGKIPMGMHCGYPNCRCGG